MKKFRALGLDGKMYDNAIEIGVGEDDMAYLVARLPKTCGIKRFLEWTGLKDKNDKEIYEGDIVKYSMQGTPQVCPSVVEWGITGFELFFQDTDSYLRVDLDSVEIIGNIYENKELLNEQRDTKCRECGN